MSENQQITENTIRPVENLSLLEKMANAIDKVLIVLSVALTAILTINLILAVFFRHVLNKPIYWADELSLLIFAWLTFLGGCLAVKRSEMAAVTMILDRLNTKMRFIFDSFIQLSILFFTVIVGYYSFLWIKSPSVLNMISSTLRIKMWWIYLIVPISMLCILIFSLSIMYRSYIEYKSEQKGATDQ